MMEPGPQVVTFYSDVDDTEQPYALYLPKDFDASKRYPLVISLHGAGSNHRLNLKRVFGKSNLPGETDVEASRYFPEWEDVDYIVASPLARGTMGYQGVAEKDVLDVLADVKRRFPIDENRIYLTGLSMGGGGTLWIGLTRPDIWAAIAPVCPAPPGGTDAFAPNALNIPVHFFQGGADPVVRPEGVREWAKRLEELGTEVEYTEYPGVAHDSWVQAYEGGRIFELFSRYQRNPFPVRVRFTTDRYKYNRAYWIRLDALTPGAQAAIDAQFSAANRIVITTTGLDGFTLLLAGHPNYTPGKPLAVQIDGASLEADAADSVSFSREEGNWRVGKAVKAPSAKGPGSEGPISEAIASRHVYVYGTAGNPSEEEARERLAVANKAADWAVYRGPFMGRVLVFPRVLADNEVRPSDFESANLVLFGTRETNTVIEKYADILPVHLNDPSGEYGLVYIYPAGGKYVLVSSGLPWWTVDPEAAPARRSPFAGQIAAFGLNGMQDFVLFKGSAENVVAEGRFDSQWRLSAEDVNKLTATGVVQVTGAHE